MGPAFNDVAGGPFWLFVAAAVVIAALAARTSRFQLVLALVNLAFCVLLTGWQAAALIALALACLHWVCQARAKGLRRWGMVAVALPLGATFLMHKWPAAAGSTPASLQPVLGMIGFSYIFLRAIEYLRASAGGATAGMPLAQTVNYLMPFHMLAAGPVMAFKDFREQGTAPMALGGDDVLSACEYLARGLFKKFVLANGLIETVFLTDFTAGGAYFLLEVQMYYLFIYLDFSAYTDIAIGIGKLLGVHTPRNFNQPLRARNIIVFWERWHISLSQFIRRNLFIPIQLAGMRWTDGRSPTVVASVAFGVAFILCGLWHGLSWRFLLWGMGHAVALIVCNLYRETLAARLGRKGAKHFSERAWVRIGATLLTFEFVALSLAFLVHPALAFLD